MKPIIFSTPMVQAILDGRKTQTRRVITRLYRLTKSGGPILSGKPIGVAGDPRDPLGLMAGCGIERPYCVPGDILWVRETWQYCEELDGNNHPIEGTGKYVYAATPEEVPHFDYWVKEDGSHADCMPWRPSIHMPKAAARIFLRVTDARVERIQDISYDNGEIWAEGIPARHDRNQEINDYIELWDSLNAKRGYGWETNPWVWVYEFKRTERPEDI